MTCIAWMYHTLLEYLLVSIFLTCQVFFFLFIPYSLSQITFLFVLKQPPFSRLLHCVSLSLCGPTISPRNCMAHSFFKQTKHELYVNKQITSFIFPVGCQTCSGASPVKLSALSVPLPTPSLHVTFLPSSLALSLTHTEQTLHRYTQAVTRNLMPPMAGNSGKKGKRNKTHI